MKNLLSTILLGAGLVFSGMSDKSKAQKCDFKSEDINLTNTEDNFPSRLASLKCYRKALENNDYLDLEYCIMGYYDKNKDNFYETIKIFKFFNGKFITQEIFYVNKNTERIDYRYKKYKLNSNKWNKHFKGLSFEEMLIKNLDYISKKGQILNYIGLSQEDLQTLGIEKRVEKIVNSGEDSENLENLLNYEKEIAQ